MSDHISQCKSCGAEIYWATLPSGKQIPVDAAPSADGNVALRMRSSTLILARIIKKGEEYKGKRRLSHFASCPHAAQHRREKP